MKVKNDEIYFYQKKLDDVWNGWNEDRQPETKIANHICLVLDILEGLEQKEIEK